MRRSGLRCACSPKPCIGVPSRSQAAIKPQIGGALGLAIRFIILQIIIVDEAQSVRIGGGGQAKSRGDVARAEGAAPRRVGEALGPVRPARIRDLVHHIPSQCAAGIAAGDGGDVALQHCGAAALLQRLYQPGRHRQAPHQRVQAHRQTVPGGPVKDPVQSREVKDAFGGLDMVPFRLQPRYQQRAFARHQRGVCGIARQLALEHLRAEDEAASGGNAIQRGAVRRHQCGSSGGQYVASRQRFHGDLQNGIADV